jgi:AraC family transcriptional regulator
VGLDAARLARALRRTYGRTLSQLRGESRLLRACELLRAAPRLPLAEIALRCGFYDQSHMTNVFRRILGVTPLQYAAQIHPRRT